MMHAALASSTPLCTSTSTSSKLTNDQRTFFDLLIGDRAGYLELAAIVGDPDTKQQGTFSRTFVYIGVGATRYAELAQQLAALSPAGNVYCSAQLYHKPSRSADVKPGRVVFVDDAPLKQACSFSVQTSPASKHAYFLLNADAPATVLRDLSQRAAAAIGGDKSGHDTQQLVRIPDTLNTKRKHGRCYPVMLREANGQAFNIATLHARWPVVERTIDSAIRLDWQAIEGWLGNIAALVNAEGLPRRFKNRSGQSARVLLQGEPLDRSQARYIVARGLIMHGYPDDEAAALLCHLCDYGALDTNGKGSAWLQADIARVLAKVRAELPNIAPSPTRTTLRAPGTPLPIVERPKRGRRIVLTPSVLLAFYQAEAGTGDMVMLTISEVAKQMHVSVATIERCEKVLKANGSIERRLFNRRQSSCVAILRPLTNTQQTLGTIPVRVPSPNSVSHDQDKSAVVRPLTNTQQSPETTPVHVPSPTSALPQQNAEDAASTVHGETHPQEASLTALNPQPLTPVAFAPTPLPSLRCIVSEAFDAYSAVRLTRKRIERYLTDNYATLCPSPAALSRAISVERTQRQQAKKLACLADVTIYGLKAELRLAEHCVDKSKRQGTNEHRWWAFYASQLRAELQCRPVEQLRANRRGVVEALPDLRAIGLAHQEELWAVVAQARTHRPRQQRTPIAARIEGVALTGVCSSQATDDVPPTPLHISPTAAGLIARLRERARTHGSSTHAALPSRVALC